MIKKSQTWRRGLSKYRYNQLWIHAYYRALDILGDQRRNNNYNDVFREIESYIESLTDEQIEHFFLMKTLGIE